MSTDTQPNATKKLFEIVSHVSTAVGLITTFQKFSGALSIDDFLAQIANTAAAVVAAGLLMAGLGIWLSALLGMGEIIDRVPTALVVIICVLVGIYWSFQSGYSIERPLSIWLGAIIVVCTVYFIYKRITTPAKKT